MLNIPATDRLAQTKVEMIASAAVDQVVRQMTRRKGRQRAGFQKFWAPAGGCKQAFTFIIIDCPPTLDLLQDSVYDFAHAAIVPVRLTIWRVLLALRNIHRGILEAQADGIDIKVEMIVPTFVRSRQRLARQMLQTLKDTYGAKRVSEPVPTSVKVEEAPHRVDEPFSSTHLGSG